MSDPSHPHQIVVSIARPAEEGLAIVRRWADEFLKDNRAVEDGEEAPATERKREVVRAGWTDGERLAHEIAESVLACGEDIVLRLDEVRADVGMALGKDLQRTEPEDQLRKAMADAGMHEMPIGKDGRRERMKIGKGVNKTVVATFDLTSLTWERVSPCHRRPSDFIGI